MNENLIITRKEEEQYTFLALQGIIDENSDFKQAFTELQPNVIINLEKVQMINSCGVREWVRFIQKIPATVKLNFEKCSPRIIEQINYVKNFIGHGKVSSFYAPYYCPKCKLESNALLEVKDLNTSKPMTAPPQHCPKCKGMMNFDDIEEEYFSFLNNDES